MSRFGTPSARKEQITRATKSITQNPHFFGFASFQALRKVYSNNLMLNEFAEHQIKSILRDNERTSGINSRWKEACVNYTRSDGLQATWLKSFKFVGLRYSKNKLHIFKLLRKATVNPTKEECITDPKGEQKNEHTKHTVNNDSHIHIMSNIKNQDYPRSYVSIFLINNFIETQTYRQHPSEPSETIIDPSTLSLDASDERLGRRLIMTLQQSRLLSKEKSGQVVSTYSSKYQGSIADRMQTFGYQDPYEFFQHMNKCFIWQCGKRIMMFPQHHIALTRWIIQENDDTISPLCFDDASVSELGAGLRLALSRCTSEEIFDRKDIPFVDKPSQLGFVSACDVDRTYPYLFVYSENTPNIEWEYNAFMEVIINDDKELIFSLCPSSNDIRLTATELYNIQIEGEMLWPGALENEASFQRDSRRYKEEPYQEAPQQETYTQNIFWAIFSVFVACCVNFIIFKKHIW